MRNVFGRRPAAASLPADATETWDGENNALVIHVPVRTERPEDHESTDRLTQVIVQVVDAINAGNVDHSVIPADATAPTAKIVIEPTHRDLGPLETRTVEIFQERLGVAIPLTVAPGAGLSAEDDGTEEAPADEDGDANAATEPDDDGTSVEIPPIAFVWDEGQTALTADVDVPLTTSDGASRRALSAALDAVFAALRDPAHRDQAPDDATPGYLVTVSYAPGAAVGPATIALQEQIDEQLAGTALTIEVVAD